MSTKNGLRFKKQSGYSLVELMIALVLGLIVISAVFNTYLGSTRSSRFTEGVQKMQENGRFGITTLQRGIRLAGYSEFGDVEPFDIASSGPSKIVVRTQQALDCNGASTATVGGVAENTYEHVADDDAIICTGNVGNERMRIVEGVEAMNILWGIDTDENKVPERYVPYASDIDPLQVIALRVAILVNSGEPIRSRASEETHVLFDREVPTDDKIARNVFTSTVLLRNGPKASSD
jgi:type IV pilus assembly protein PilW